MKSRQTEGSQVEGKHEQKNEHESAPGAIFVIISLQQYHILAVLGVTASTAVVRGPRIYSAVAFRTIHCSYAIFRRDDGHSERKFSEL